MQINQRIFKCTDMQILCFLLDKIPKLLAYHSDSCKVINCQKTVHYLAHPVHHLIHVIISLFSFSMFSFSGSLEDHTRVEMIMKCRLRKQTTSTVVCVCMFVCLCVRVSWVFTNTLHVSLFVSVDLMSSYLNAYWMIFKEKEHSRDVVKQRMLPSNV